MTVRPSLDRFLAAVPLVAILLGHLWLVPLWDGMQYAQCVIDSLRPGHSLLQLNCFGHPTIAYTGPLALAALLRYGSYVPFLLVNAALGVLACASFHRIAEQLAPGPERRLERFLATAAFGVAPAFVASAANLTPDYAVCVFLLATVSALLDRRRLHAVLYGCALVLSKELGIVLFATAVALEALVPLERTGESFLRRVRIRLVYVIPVLAFGAVRFVQARTPGAPDWAGVAARHSLFDLLLGLAVDARLLAYAVLMFLFQFQWIATLLALGLLARRRERTTWLAAGLVAASVYAETRFITFANVRYLLPTVPLLLLAATAGLGALKQKGARVALLGAIAGLNVLSLWTSSDPVSRAIFHTFEVGDRRLYRMTSVSNECCGHGRDQLVYNLQFAAFDRLLSRLLADVKPSADAPILLPRDANWFVLQQVDPATHERTLRPPDDPALPYLPAAQKPLPPRADRPWASTVGLLRMQQDLPRTAWFVAFPNVDYTLDVALLRRKYEVRSTREVRWGGYAIDVAELSLR